LKADLAEIEIQNNHYFKRLSHGVAERLAHVRRRERLEQIVHDLVALKQKSATLTDGKFR
jgi:hypothetical protein